MHADFTGPVAGQMYLVVVDAYSKYPDVVKMNSTTSISTMNVLWDIFSRHGLPELLVTNNGPQFTSSEFKKFCVQNGFVRTESERVHNRHTN